MSVGPGEFNFAAGAAAALDRRQPTAHRPLPAQRAFVLHSYDWSESSLIVELFTRDAGRVVAAAKGAKRPTSQLRAVLMPFQMVLVQFARSRGEQRRRGCAPCAVPSGAAATSLPCAGRAGSRASISTNCCCGCWRATIRTRGCSMAYAATLHALGDNELRSEAALRAFELLLLRETGVLPSSAAPR